MKRVWKTKEVIKGWEGKPIKISIAEDPFDEDSDVEVGDLTVFAAMMVVSNLCKVETLDDASKKKMLKQSLKASIASGKIELEAEVYKWLKAASERVCPQAWQDNANEVHDILTEGYRKENDPPKSPSKAKGKDTQDASETERSD